MKRLGIITTRNAKNMKIPQGTNRGFTLIELMIVVAIIAIILTLGLPVYSNYIIRAKISEALNVANGAKTAVSTSCQETPTIPALTNALAGYNDITVTKYVASIQLTGPCTDPVITITTQATGAPTDPTLTITGELRQGHMDFTCVSDGPNRHVPSECRS